MDMYITNITIQDRGYAVKSTGYAAYAVANYPLSKKVNLSAKLGVLQWNADLQVNNKTPLAAVPTWHMVYRHPITLPGSLPALLRGRVFNFK